MRLSRLTNTMPRLILRSPIHRVMSGKYTIITFRGRTSGRTYTTPVAYAFDGDAVVVSTDSPWWRNLEGGRDVVLRLRNRDVTAVASPVHDRERAQRILRRLVDEIPTYARFAGLERSGSAVPDEVIARAVDGGRVAIEIRPCANGSPVR